MTALVVHRAIGWAASGMQVTAEDWPSAPTALAALRSAVASINFYSARLGLLAARDIDFDAMADRIAVDMGMDPDRPYGMAILVEDAEIIRKTHQADRAGRSAGP